MPQYDAYAHPSQPWTTSYGDDLFASVPAGWNVVVTQQPTNGLVDVTGVSGWSFTASALPAVANGMVSDSWQWHATNGTDTTPTVTVTLDIYNVA